MRRRPVMRLGGSGSGRTRARARPRVTAPARVLLALLDLRPELVRGGIAGGGRRSRGRSRCREAVRCRCLPRGRVRRLPLGAPDHRHDDERQDGNGDETPPPRYSTVTSEGPELRESPETRGPQPGDRGDQARRRVPALPTDGGRRLHRIVQGGRVLTPEGVRRRGHAGFGVAQGRAGPRGGTDRNELLRRAQPVARQPYDVLLAPSQPATVFGSPIARFHGFADLSSVRLPFRLPGEVQYNSELAPVCLN